MTAPSVFSRRLTAAALTAAVALALPVPLAAGLYGSPSARIQDSFGAGWEGLAFDHDQMGGVLAVGDFNGDGLDDLAVSDRESLTEQNEGAVHVIYGSLMRLAPSGDVLIKDFIPGTGASDREIGDAFGDSLAAGDFDGDGMDDLAIGIPFEDIGAATDGGEVLVLFGSAQGLPTSGPARGLRIAKNSFFGITPKINDRLSHSLAAGDIDGDGRDDLVIGCPSCASFTAGEEADAGQIYIQYGTATGLAPRDFRSIWDQDSTDVLSSGEVGDSFGWSIALGDFDDDGFDDVAVGVPNEDFGSGVDVGVVNVLYGAAAGLDAAGNQLWHEGNAATGGDEGDTDRFGLTLAAGDLTGEGVDDLAIGAPNEDLAGLVDAGAVTLLWGQAGVGLDTPGSEIYDQSSVGDGETPESFENFGASLAIGDFIDANAPGALDLAVGIPQEEVFDPVTLFSLPKAGSVSILPGGFGLNPVAAELWFQGWRGSAGGADLAADQLYGFSIVGGDFDGDGHGDLAIGAPWVDGETSPGQTAVDAGAVYVLYGSLFADGFETGTLYWSSHTP